MKERNFGNIHPKLLEALVEKRRDDINSGRDNMRFSVANRPGVSQVVFNSKEVGGKR